MKKKADLNQTLAELGFKVIEAACQVEDIDWNADDPTPPLDALSSAVKAYREKLRRVRPWASDLQSTPDAPVP
jgi:hypothetical protein